MGRPQESRFHTDLLRRQEDTPFPTGPVVLDALDFLIRTQRTDLQLAGIWKVSCKKTAKGLKRNVSLSLTPKDLSRTFEVGSVDLNPVDASRVTESEHGPLPATQLKDALLVHLKTSSRVSAAALVCVLCVCTFSSAGRSNLRDVSHPSAMLAAGPGPETQQEL